MPTASFASPTILRTGYRSARKRPASAAPRAYPSFSISGPRTRRSMRRFALPARAERRLRWRPAVRPAASMVLASLSSGTTRETGVRYPGNARGGREMCELCYVDEAIKGKIIARNSEFHKVASSPFGEDDEAGMLNLIDAESRTAILRRADPTKVYDLSVDHFIGMPG